MNLKKAWDQAPKEKIYCNECGEITLHEIYAGKISCLKCRANEFGRTVEENKIKGKF